MCGLYLKICLKITAFKRYSSRKTCICLLCGPFGFVDYMLECSALLGVVATNKIERNLRGKKKEFQPAVAVILCLQKGKRSQGILV